MNELPHGPFEKGYQPSGIPFTALVRQMRDAQKKWKKTLDYGWRCEAVRLEKQVDELLNEMQDGE